MKMTLDITFGNFDDDCKDIFVNKEYVGIIESLDQTENFILLY